jgi:hypothetical protein
MWRWGYGVASSVNLPHLVWVDTTSLENLPSWLLRSLGWSIIAVQLSFPGAYAWNKTRGIIACTMIAMHVGIAIIYPLPVFSALMIAALSATFPDEWYRPLRGMERRLQGRAPIPVFPSSRIAVSTSYVIAASWLGLSFAVSASGHVPSQIMSGYSGVNRAQGTLLSLTGITSHSMFGESIFIDYEHQLRLRVSDRTVPLTPGNLYSFWVRDRVWADWWQRLQSPRAEISGADDRLLAWARFCYRSPPGEAREVIIETRRQSMSLHELRPDLFRANNAEPWRRIGVVRLSDAGDRVDWDDPPRDGEKSIGPYLRRLLSQSSLALEPDNRR